MDFCLKSWRFWRAPKQRFYCFFLKFPNVFSLAIPIEKREENFMVLNLKVWRNMWKNTGFPILFLTPVKNKIKKVLLRRTRGRF